MLALLDRLLIPVPVARIVRRAKRRLARIAEEESLRRAEVQAPDPRGFLQREMIIVAEPREPLRLDAHLVVRRARRGVIDDVRSQTRRGLEPRLVETHRVHVRARIRRRSARGRRLGQRANRERRLHRDELAALLEELLELPRARLDDAPVQAARLGEQRALAGLGADLPRLRARLKQLVLKRARSPQRRPAEKGERDRRAGG